MNQRFLMMLSLVGQLGFIIALPVAVLGFGGAFLDKQLGTSPLFILLGMGLAIASSSVWLYRFIKKIDQQTNN